MAKQPERTQTALKPPAPPEIERKLKFYRLQAIGVPIIALLPLLAMFKVFDTTRAVVSANSEGLALEVVYPAKLRDRTYEPFTLSVRNGTGDRLSKLVIELDRSYLDQFRDVEFEPGADEIDERSLKFEFYDVEAGEVRKVQAVFRSDDLGTHPCRARAVTSNGTQVEAEFSTFVLP